MATPFRKGSWFVKTAFLIPDTHTLHELLMLKVVKKE
jgi:hypothetical protein